jgi:hypothetical protein
MFNKITKIKKLAQAIDCYYDTIFVLALRHTKSLSAAEKVCYIVFTDLAREDPQVDDLRLWLVDRALVAIRKLEEE